MLGCALWLFGVLGAPSALAQVANGGFDTDLTGWTTVQDGGAASPGAVSWDAGEAVLVEGDSHMVRLEQTFALPLRPDTLSFRLTPTPGLDGSAAFLPDAFEAHLVDGARRPLAPSWKPGASSFFNLQENGDVRLGSGTTWDGSTVQVDLSALAQGTQATLVLALVGGDADLASEVRIDGVTVTSVNGAPVAVLGPDLVYECASGGLSLDGSASYDPDGDVLSFVWTDDTAAAVGSDPTLDVDPPVGTWTWTLTVADPLGAFHADSVEVTVEDTVPPTAPAGPLAYDIDEAGTCAGAIPDLTGLITPADACGGVTVGQDVAAGTPLVLGSPVTVVLTTTDDEGNSTPTTVVVTLTDLDGSCAMTTGTGTGSGTGSTTGTGSGAATGTGTGAATGTGTGTGAATGTGTGTGAATGTGTGTGEDTARDTDQADRDKGGCGCDATGAGAPVGGLAIAALWLLWRRRRAAAPLAALAALLLLQPAPASAHTGGAPPTPIAIGDVVAGEVAAAGEIEVYTFTAAPGQAIYLRREATNNYLGLNWHIEDSYGRVLGSGGTDLNDIPRIVLMGGDYTLSVFGEPGQVGTYTFWLADSPSVDEGAIGAGTAHAAAMVGPSERHTWTFEATEGQRVHLSLLSATAWWEMSWTLLDPHGRPLFSSPQLASGGPWTLEAGTHTLEVRSRGAWFGDYSFRLDDIGAPVGGVAAIDGAHAAGTLAGPRDHVDWTFTASGGERIFVEPIAFANYWDCAWQLIDPHGNVVAAPGTMEARGPFVLVAGEWTLRILNELDATGAYDVAVRSVADLPDGTVTIGGTASAPFDRPFQTAGFDFTAAPSTRLGLEATAGSPWDVGVSIADVHGRLVQPLTGDAFFKGPLPLEGGDYHLVIDPEVASFVPTDVRLFEVTDWTAPAALGGTYSDATVEPGDTWAYVFNAAPGQVLQIAVPTTSAYWEMGYRVVDPLGRVVLGPTAEMYGSTVALMGGTYSLVVDPEGPWVGSWTIDLIDAGASTFTPPPGLPMGLDAPVTGTLAPGADDVYTLDLAADAQLFLDLTIAGGTLQWELLDEVGEPVFALAAANDPYWSDRGPLDLRAGTYTLTVHDAAGAATAYGFVAHSLASTGGGTFALGDVVSDALVVPGEVHAWTFDVTSAGRHYFDIRQPIGGSVWTLYDPAGATVFASSFAGTFYEDLEVVLGPGTYTLVIDAPQQTTGPYAFAVFTPNDAQELLALGATGTATPAAPGDTKTFRFDAAEGDRVYLDLLTHSGNGRWTLTDPAGQVRIAGADTANADYYDLGPMTVSAGTWELRYDPLYDALTPMSFQIAQPSPGLATPIALDTDVVGTFLQPGDIHVYTLDLAEPTEAYIDILVPLGTAVWTIRDPHGNAMIADQALYDPNAADPGRATLAPGTWTFTVRGATSTSGTYTFRVGRVVDASSSVAARQPTDALVSQPGQVIDHVFTAAAGTTVLLDLLVADTNGQWSLIDPVGQPVFASPANNPDIDLGPVTLADGDYVVRFDPVWSLLSTNRFEIFEIDLDAPHFFYTRYSGAPNVKRGYYHFAGSTFVPDAKAPVTSTATADGIVILPDGDLLVGGGFAIHKIDPDTGAVISASPPPGTSTYHLALDPSGTRAWSSAMPGTLVEIPLVPFGDGIAHTLTGDDLAVTQLAFDRQGRAYYATGGSTGGGSFGRIDLATMETTRLLSGLPSAHGMAFDPYFDQILVFGANHVTQIDPESATVVADFVAPAGIQFDQGTADGAGRVFVADNFGELLVLDYSQTGLVDDPSNVVYLEPYEPGFDDVAPMSWLGAPCWGQPPVVGLSPAAGTVLPTGSQVVIQGRVPSIDPTRPVAAVLVDGVPADALDVAGNFFAVRTLAEGVNSFHIEAIDRCGQADLWLDLVGGLDPDRTPSADHAVGAWVSEVWSDTTWSTDRQQLLVDVRAENTSEHPIVGPLLLAVGPQLDPAISLAAATGLTAEGWAYAEVVPAGATLDPGARSDAISLAFDDPDRLPVRFDPIWLAPGNSAPRFTSVPPARVVQGQPWTYRPTAVDAEGHALTWSLVSGPPGMTLELATGHMDWSPSMADLGAFEVRIRVSDGFGGVAEQTFVLAVVPGAVNSPPLITSAPPPRLSVGAALAYDAQATDLDGDPLAWSLDAGPAGMALDPATGLLSWALATPGTHPVAIRVEDGRGGSAIQAWTLAVGEVSANPNAPLITTTPPLEAAVANLYLYQPLASDPDGQPLTWTLVQGPPGVGFDPATGRLSWTPVDADLGVHPVAIEVSDGSASVRQAWDVTVTDALANRPPVVTSRPGTTAVVGVAWSYDARAFDPEAGPLTWDLPAAPAGMTIDPATGATTWTPQPGDEGTHAVAVRATDATGATSSQFFLLDVRASNSDPVVTSGPPAPVWVGALLTHGERAVDADGDPLAWSLVQGPAGMAIDPTTGLVTWRPSLADQGSHPVTVRVTDPWGGSADDLWTLDVQVDTAAPSVELTVGGDPACLDLPVQVCARAADDVGVDSLVLLADGAGQTLDPFGCVDLVPDALGTLTLDARATDANGNEGSAGQGLLVVDCDDPELPSVTVISPRPGVLLEGPTDLVVDIDDNTPVTLTWTVSASPHGQDRWTELASGSGAVTGGAVATLDTTLLPNDDYDLRIEAEDGANLQTATWTVGVGGPHKLGHFSLTTTDLQLELGGIPLSVSRTYESLNVDTQGDFGLGWSLGLSGAVWDTEPEETGEDLLGFFGDAPYQWTTRVYVVKPTGERVGFTFDPVPLGGLAPFQYTPAFDPDPGVDDSLEVVGGPATVWNYGSGFVDWIVPYNPDTFRLTTPAGLTWELGEQQGLIRVEDVGGNTITVTRDALVHSAGDQLGIERDPAGRITRILEPDPDPGDGIDPPALTYTYDGLGNLASFSDALGNTTTYRYEEPALPSHLTGIDDPTGRALVRTIYDADGRIAAQCPADGDPLTLTGCAEVTYDVAGGLTSTFDARGWQTDWFFDAVGNVTLERHWVEGGLNEDFAYTWDADRNLLASDQGGVITTSEWDDQGRRTRWVEPGGGSWTWTYGTCRSPLTQTGPTGDTWTWTYDERCRNLAVTDPLGHTVAWTHGAFGPLSRTDAVGNTWTWAYDGQGRIAGLTDTRGRTMTWTWQNGRLESQTDRTGRRMDFAWDAAGRLATETWDDGRVITWTWEADGRVASVTDPDHTVSLGYTPTGHVASLDYAGTPGAPPMRLDYTWDGAGRADQVLDAAGGLTDYDHDAMRRLSSITQTGPGVSPKRVELDYDATQRPVAIRRYADAAGLVPVVHTDIGIDLEHPLRPGQLDHVRTSDGAALHALDVVRDALGNVVAATDAEGSHSYEVDGLRRITAATHPPAGIQPDESYGWDAAGNRLSSHLSAVHLHGYQTGTGGDQLEEDDSHLWLWDADGRLIRRTDKATGEALELDWDHRGRLVELRQLDGGGTPTRTVRTTWDAFDRRLKVEDDGIVTWILHDGPNPVLELDGGGTARTRRLYGTVIDHAHAEEVSGSTRWLLQDVVGNVRDRVDDGGNVVDHLVYDSFGRTLAGGPGLGFGARPADAGTGLIDLRARTYDPASGRFVSRDPKLPYGYAFAEGAPLIYGDPTGESVAVSYACMAVSAVGTAVSASKVASPVKEILEDVSEGLDGAIPAGGTHDLGSGIVGMMSGALGPYMGPFVSPPDPDEPLDELAAVTGTWASFMCAGNDTLDYTDPGTRQRWW